MTVGLNTFHRAVIAKFCAEVNNNDTYNYIISYNIIHVSFLCTAVV